MTRTVELIPKPASVRTARVFTAGVLGDDGVEGSVIELAVLLVSEVVTNAAVRTPNRIRVTVHVDSHWVRVEVEDQGPGRPVLGPSPPKELMGPGLAIVEGLSTDWGTDLHNDHRTVWFEIAR